MLPDCEKTYMAESLFQKAFIEYLKIEYSRLLEKEEKVLRTDPRNVGALINKGFALANLNRETEALQSIDRALQVDPENLTALSNKAYLAKVLGYDILRARTLMTAYNVSAKNRMREIAHLESKLLNDFGSAFVAVDAPSVFDAFNKQSGIQTSKAIH